MFDANRISASGDKFPMMSRSVRSLRAVSNA